ncbi:MAG TPA: BON domain-containing protein [Planctomycetota bacterium]|nr:BON domain-containing protein [Planctomycetota bacterium]
MIDPSEFSDEELEIYLREVLHNTEELADKGIEIRVKNDTVYLTGYVPGEMQRRLVEILVLNVIPEDRLVNDLRIFEESLEEPDVDVPDEPPAEIAEEAVEVEREDPEKAAQEGETYEPPTAPVPEPTHEDEW